MTTDTGTAIGGGVRAGCAGGAAAKAFYCFQI